MLIFLGQNVKQNIIMVTVTLCAAAFGWQIDTVSFSAPGQIVLLYLWQEEEEESWIISGERHRLKNIIT